MNKNLIIFGIIVLLVSVVLSGCFDNKTNSDSSGNGNGSKANLIMAEWQYETNWDSIKGDYVTINFVIKNNGSANATGISVALFSTNQDNLLEANKTTYLQGTLSPDEVRGVSFKFGYEMENILLNNKLTIRWNGGSREYSQVINL